MTRDRSATLAVAAGALLAAAYLGMAGKEASTLADANDAGSRRDYGRAIELSRDVDRRPASTGALLVQARAYASQGRDRRAQPAYARAAELAPNDWRVHRDWSVVLLRLGRTKDAQRTFARALALNPRLEPPAGIAVVNASDGR